MAGSQGDDGTDSGDGHDTEIFLSTSDSETSEAKAPQETFEQQDVVVDVLSDDAVDDNDEFEPENSAEKIVEKQPKHPKKKQQLRLGTRTQPSRSKPIFRRKSPAKKLETTAAKTNLKKIRQHPSSTSNQTQGKAKVETVKSAAGSNSKGTTPKSTSTITPDANTRIRYLGLDALDTNLDQLRLKHKDFLRPLRLDKFFNLKWERTPSDHLDIIHEFIENYNSKTMKTRIQNREIQLTDDLLGAVFALPEGTFEVPGRVPYTSQNFPKSQPYKTGNSRSKGYKIAQAPEPWFTRYTALCCLFAFREIRKDVSQSFACWVETGKSDHNLSGAFHGFLHKELRRVKQVVTMRRTASTFVGLHIILIHDHCFPKSAAALKSKPPRPRPSSGSRPPPSPRPGTPKTSTKTEITLARSRTNSTGTTTATGKTITLMQKDLEQRAIEATLHDIQAMLVKYTTLHDRRWSSLKLQTLGLKREAERAEELDREVYDLRTSHHILEEALRSQLEDATVNLQQMGTENKRLEFKSGKMQKKLDNAVLEKGDMKRRYERALEKKSGEIRRALGEYGRKLEDLLEQVRNLKVQTVGSDCDEEIWAELERFRERVLEDERRLGEKAEVGVAVDMNVETNSGNAEETYPETYVSKSSKKPRRV